MLYIVYVLSLGDGRSQYTNNGANITRIFLSRKVELLFLRKINAKYQESGIRCRF